MKTKKIPGRPARALTPGERVPMSFRVRPELKEKMDRWAEASGRSVAQEVELRLEQSSTNEATVEQGLDFSFGRRLAALLRLFGRVALDVGPIAAFQKTGKHDDAINWLSEPFAYDQVVKGVTLVLEALRPDGDIAPPTGNAESLHERMASGALIAIKDRECGGELGDWARPVRERLGEIVDRIRIDPNAPISVNLLPPQVVEGGRQVRGRILDTHIGRSLGRQQDNEGDQ
jgi:hypothetical protein